MMNLFDVSGLFRLRRQFCLTFVDDVDDGLTNDRAALLHILLRDVEGRDESNRQGLVSLGKQSDKGKLFLRTG